MTPAGWLAAAALLVLGAGLAVVVYQNATREHLAEGERQYHEAQLAEAEAARLRRLLELRTAALSRVVAERDELRAVMVRAAQLERIGWAAYKLRAQGDAPVRPSQLIADAAAGAAAQEARSGR